MSCWDREEKQWCTGSIDDGRRDQNGVQSRKGRTKEKHESRDESRKREMGERERGWDAKYTTREQSLTSVMHVNMMRHSLACEEDFSSVQTSKKAMKPLF